MTDYKFVALVNARPGSDDEFNAWHSETHLPEVVKAGGFTRGQRLKLVEGSTGDNARYQYLVIFEGTGDDPMACLAKVGAAVADGRISMSDTLAMPTWSSLYEPIPGAVVEV